MPTFKDAVLARLDGLIREGQQAAASYYVGEVGGYDSRLKEEDLRAFVAAAAAAIEQIAGVALIQFRGHQQEGGYGVRHGRGVEQAAAA